jgi:hypothetical protein
LADSCKRLLSELSNASLRLIAQHSQVEPTVEQTLPTVELTVESAVKPNIKPTIETTIDIHQYTIRADRNQFDDILIDTQSELIAINSTTMPIDIQSEPIAIAAITCIQAFIGHLAIYAS